MNDARGSSGREGDDFGKRRCRGGEALPLGVGRRGEGEARLRLGARESPRLSDGRRRRPRDWDGTRDSGPP